jgi:hypothetical protein
LPTKSLFPRVPVSEARTLADTIAHKNAGQPMRRLDIFEVLEKSPDSGPSRTLVTASSSYGLTSGGYTAETLSLASLGQRLSVEGDGTALIDAILSIDVFKQFFEKYKNGALPAEVSAKSFLAGAGVPLDRVQACWDILLENGRYVGLIAEMSGGGERVLTREHAIDRRFGNQPDNTEGNAPGRTAATGAQQVIRKIPGGLPSLNINVEVHLPADVRPEVYDAIFSSMRKHLIDVE